MWVSMVPAGGMAMMLESRSRWRVCSFHTAPVAGGVAGSGVVDDVGGVDQDPG